MEGLRPHAEMVNMNETEREERLYQVSEFCQNSQFFAFFNFHPQLARQLVGAELQQIVYR